MSTTPSFEAGHVRSRLYCNGVITLSLGAILVIGSLSAQATRGTVLHIKPGESTLFDQAKQIDADLPHVGCMQAGPADGAPVILLQGWHHHIRYDALSFRGDVPK